MSNKVHFVTNYGDFTVELNPEKAPVTVKNFLDYVQSGFYTDTIFHRVINGFMIQGGGFDKNMVQKPTRGNIQNEARNGLKNETYTIAMARSTNPHSASSQFFINVTDNAFLDYPGQDGWGYCVFGKVIEGQETVFKIRGVKTHTFLSGSKPGGHSIAQHADVPVEPVIINSVTVVD